MFVEESLASCQASEFRSWALTRSEGASEEMRFSTICSLLRFLHSQDPKRTSNPAAFVANRRLIGRETDGEKRDKHRGRQA